MSKYIEQKGHCDCCHCDCCRPKYPYSVNLNNQDTILQEFGQVCKTYKQDYPNATNIELERFIDEVIWMSEDGECPEEITEEEIRQIVADIFPDFRV